MEQQRAKSRSRAATSQSAARGYGSHDGNLRTKAIAVDPEIKGANIRRLRRLEGQIRGLQKMVEEDRYCPDIMVQISAAQEALRTVGRELTRNHLRHCVTKSLIEDPDQAKPVFDELLELIYKHSR